MKYMLTPPPRFRRATEMAGRRALTLVALLAAMALAALWLPTPATTQSESEPQKPTVSLSIAPNPVMEGQSVTVTVQLSAPLAKAVDIPVTVHGYGAYPGGAAAVSATLMEQPSSDFDPAIVMTSDWWQPYMVAIDAGETRGTVMIRTKEDTVVEYTENFPVKLGHPRPRWPLPDAVAWDGWDSADAVIVAITDNDEPTTVSLEDATLIWSATLNPTTLRSRGSKGCDNRLSGSVRCSHTDRLNDNSFTYDGEDYTVGIIELSSFYQDDNRLLFSLNQNISTHSPNWYNELALVIDSHPFPFKDAATHGGGAQWYKTGRWRGGAGNIFWWGHRNEKVQLQLYRLRPGPVAGLQLRVDGDSGISANWQAPERDGVPTRYIAHIRPEKGGTGSGKTKYLEAGETEIVFPGLETGRTYKAWVRGENAVGKGERVHATIELPPAPTQAPGPVLDLQLTATADSITATWQAPATGGAPTRYIAHIRPEGGEAGSGKTKYPKTKKPETTFRNLEAGTTYKVWVRGENAMGKGERVHASISLPE